MGLAVTLLEKELNSGETILWEATPDPALYLRDSWIRPAVLVLVFSVMIIMCYHSTGTVLNVTNGILSALILFVLCRVVWTYVGIKNRVYANTKITNSFLWLPDVNNACAILDKIKEKASL